MMAAVKETFSNLIDRFALLRSTPVPACVPSEMPMTVTPLVRPLAHGTLVPRPTERQMRILSFAIKNMMPPLHQNLLLAFCGPPGCGKTYLAQYLVALGVSRGMWTRSQSITTALQAVRCQTLRGNHLHAMFGWIPGVKMSFQKYVSQARDNMTDRNREKIRSARILVIASSMRSKCAP